MKRLMLSMKKIVLLTMLSFYSSLSFGLDSRVKMINFSARDQLKVMKTLQAIKKVISSSQFKYRVLNHTYQGEKKFLDNKGHSNQKIFQTILEGAEELNPQKDGCMDLELELMESESRTVGHTYPETKRIWINRKYFDQFTPPQIGNNLFHEWMHKLGYDHSPYDSIERRYSVPYAIGFIIEELLEDL